MTHSNYLIDSDILIDFLEYGLKFPHSFEHSNNTISVITYYEVKYGAVRTKRNIEFDQFIDEAQINIANLTPAIIDKSVEIRILLERQGRKIDHLDTFIGATAVTENLILVTKNIRHFKHIPDLALFRTNQD